MLFRSARNLESNLGATSSSVKNVSSSFSRQIAKGAIYAVVVSFALIMLYISLRFQWRFAIPILRTLFSDILITLGIYAMSGREVTTATVAAILTVLGYSSLSHTIVPRQRNRPYAARRRRRLPHNPRLKLLRSTLQRIRCLRRSKYRRKNGQCARP